MVENAEGSAEGDTDDGIGHVGLSILMATVMAVWGYGLASGVYGLLQRSGLPIGPFAWIAVNFVIFMLVCRYEKRVQNHPKFHKFKDIWYYAVIGLTFLGPTVLAIFWPVPVWHSLPVGGAFLCTLAAFGLVIVAIIVRAKYPSKS